MCMHCQLHKTIFAYQVDDLLTFSALLFHMYSQVFFVKKKEWINKDLCTLQHFLHPNNPPCAWKTFRSKMGWKSAISSLESFYFSPLGPFPLVSERLTGWLWRPGSLFNQLLAVHGDLVRLLQSPNKSAGMSFHSCTQVNAQCAQCGSSMSTVNPGAAASMRVSAAFCPLLVS